MKVHELTWSSQKPFMIQARELSCLECKPDEICIHYGLGTIQLSKPSPLQLLEMDLDRKIDSDNETSSASSECHQDTETIIHNFSDLDVGDYVVVQLQGKKNMKFYIAYIEAVENENEFGVFFMRTAVGGKFVFPNKEDRAVMELRDVIEVLGKPSIHRGRYSFPNNLLKYKFS
ncbi:uncharacterized protein LOC116164786 [Photinus pyralis]|uniref:uncharacterized protein LOC116164786 n=1 Tax=Photinus pyralis TaxID=7054 RepID=UPI0012676642|nr:uncharacterized protein LOC116164786 [Photinus pyralis]